MTQAVLLHAIVLMLVAPAASRVSAQEYPARPVRLVIGFSAGSGVDWDTWFGLLAPAKTPRTVVKKLHADVTRILVLPEVNERWNAMGAEPLPIAPDAFDRYIADQVALVARLAKAAGMSSTPPADLHLCKQPSCA